MPKTLVLFSSRTGRTAALADAIAEGASAVKFAEVDVRWLPALAVREGEGSAAHGIATEALARKYRLLAEIEELLHYDALVLGSPSHAGGVTPELQQFLERAASLFGGGKLVGRAGSAFATGPREGAEATLSSIMKPMATLGMLLVPPGPADGNSASASPYGATSSDEGGPDAADLAVARRQGKRVATVAAMVAHVRSHHHHH